MNTKHELQQWYSTTLKDRTKIQRVSGDSLPMEHCYINLAVIESQPKQIGKELKQPFYRLTSSEYIVNTNPNDSITLDNLFKPRRLKSGLEGIPKRILVKGRAGVGKTTLAKKSVYDSINNGLWKEQFDWVLWIPLRRLKGKPEHYSFKTFLQDEYSKENRDDEALAAALYQSIQTTPARTLLILDGWDEIAQESRTDCLRTLINHPSILITTRPSGISSNEIEFLDLELETIGFSASNVMAYLDHPAIVDPEIGQAIKQFIQKHSFVRELVNIPIQLDALCFSWDEIDPNDPAPTMTGLYQAMTRKLWRKDIINLGRLNALGMIEPQVTLMRQFSGLEAEIQPEQQCLGALALNGLDNNQIEFTLSDLKTAVEQVETRRTDLHDTMDHLSFLQVERAEGSRTRLSYQFLHLIFQEYFAAQWLVHHLKTGTPLQFPQKTISVKAFIHQAQYNPRYEIVWRFVAGLLDTQELTAFFDLLDGGPKDLIGLQHQVLLMNWLRESDDRLQSDLKERIESTLYDWLVFEIDWVIDSDDDYVSRLGRQAVFPESILLALLEDTKSLYEFEIIIVDALGARPTLSHNAIQALLVLAAKDMDTRMRWAAAEALGQCASLEAVEALLSLAKDADWEVRRNTAWALGRCVVASPKAVEALRVLAVDENLEVRTTASRVLGQCVSLEDAEALLVLAKYDADVEVRWNAAMALAKHPSASSKAVEALLSLAKDADWEVRRTAASALSQDSDALPNSVEALLALAKEADLESQRTVDRVLGQGPVVSPEALEPLHVLAKDEDASVRRSAANVLGQCAVASPKVVETLIALAKDEEAGVRRKATQALGNQPLWNIYHLLPTADSSLLADLYKYYLIPSNFKQIAPLYLHANQLCFYTPEGLQSIPLNDQAVEFSQAILNAQQAGGIPLASRITIQDSPLIGVSPSYASFFTNPQTDLTVSDQYSEETARLIGGDWPMDL